MFVKNGSSCRNTEYNYYSSHFREGTFDLDVIMLQAICASVRNINLLVSFMFDACCLKPNLNKPQSLMGMYTYILCALPYGMHF